MKRVVSVSLGSSTRNSVGEVEFLGQRIRMERLGTDGDWNKLLNLLHQLDGQVDAIGIGGIKLHVHAAGKAYPLRGSAQVARAVSRSPLVDGSGLKDTIERRAFHIMEDEGLPVKGTKTLLMSAVDRFGMAETLWEMQADVIFGDFMFGLGINLPLRKLSTIWWYGSVIGPFLKFIPFEWLYPTGKKQEKITPKFGQYYQWAEMVAGDFHYIRRYMPDSLENKVIVTNTVTAQDVELLRQRKARALVTGSPEINGRSFATNALEAMLVALAGEGRSLSSDEYNALLDRIGYRPRIEYLQQDAQVAATNS
ncbi:MAG: quinate 5-dehydrogenase [Bacillota bacterium]|jgi:hypothetical protein